MKNSLFDFDDYKVYLAQRARSQGVRSGFKLGLARAAGCNQTYISNVLGGEAQLSLEQADAINQHLQHTPDESRYFLLLVQKERAGTESLRRHFVSDLKVLRTKRLEVKEHLGFQGELRPEDRNHYYSAWYFAALHVALSVPSLRTPQALGRYFRLPLKTVAEVLDFLVQTGLALEKRGEFSIGPSLVHLGNDAEQIVMHHTSWRVQAISHLASDHPDDLHYSAALTLARKDLSTVKGILLQALKEAMDVITVSPEEEVCVLNFDFFNFRSAE